MRAEGTRRWLLALYAGLFLTLAQAQSGLRPLPPMLRTVSDEAGALSADEGRRLAAALHEIFERTGVRMVIVIAETTRPEPIEDYAQRLARRWLEERRVDPTRIIFVVASMKEREMQVMPGRALRLTDALFRDDPTGPPVGALFKEEHYFEALMLIATRMLALIEKNPPPLPEAEKERR